ncbi:serine/threonine-protein kinase [Streptomyces scabiei]|uniref:serine/threonine-protein kinase n=1 Tax=Streptomyces scabiei TaxID=1930 RepID=UPI00099D668F|nr:serine/threonine-protein kinase [Streptomyces scabiei]
MPGLHPGDPLRIGVYRTERRLGAGGQGVVYEAYGPAGERVAVKVPSPESLALPGAPARLAKEVAAARRVASFCTARVLDADTAGEQPYLVSEFVPGHNLGAAVRERGPFRGDALVRLAMGLATAVAAIHGAGVLHRDLKPANVLIGPDGPRVIDFGLARTQEMTLTDGVAGGTYGYMAPEVLRGKPPTAAADVFAWAAVVLFG